MIQTSLEFDNVCFINEWQLLFLIDFHCEQRL